MNEADVFGSNSNFWRKTPTGIDLTRGLPGGKTIKATKDEILLLPSKTALVIVDMQNFFLHPKFSENQAGRDIVPALIRTVEAARKAGVHVIWVNWGFTEDDLETIQPGYAMTAYQRDKVPFGENLGEIDGHPIGPRLWRGSWNAQLWGDLQPLAEEGIQNGTDVWICKNRFSGMHGQQDLDKYLKKHEITTTMVCGVVTDVCVYGTWLDLYYEGYDAVLIRDLSKTHRAEHVTLTAHGNAEAWGWLVDSKDIIDGLSA